LLQLRQRRELGDGKNRPRRAAFASTPGSYALAGDKVASVGAVIGTFLKLVDQSNEALSLGRNLSDLIDGASPSWNQERPDAV
jgi:hypothetical protein